MHLCSVHALSLHLCSNINIYIYMLMFIKSLDAQRRALIWVSFFSIILHMLNLYSKKKPGWILYRCNQFYFDNFENIKNKEYMCSNVFGHRLLYASALVLLGHEQASIAKALKKTCKTNPHLDVGLRAEFLMTHER